MICKSPSHASQDKKTGATTHILMAVRAPSDCPSVSQLSAFPLFLRFVIRCYDGHLNYAL